MVCPRILSDFVYETSVLSMKMTFFSFVCMCVCMHGSCDCSLWEDWRVMNAEVVFHVVRCYFKKLNCITYQERNIYVLVPD